MNSESGSLDAMRQKYPEKFASEEQIFSKINRGDRIFIGTGCGEPQHLVKALIRYVESNPKAFFDTEIFHVWTMGVAPYTADKFKRNFRHNSFFIGEGTRDAINQGMADYTPIFLSAVPKLFERGMIMMDVALIQTSPPDSHGYMSLGISVDIVKAAVEKSNLVIAQINKNMPRVHGDGFLHIEKVDYVLPHDEPLLEFTSTEPDDITEKIGKYVARIVQDGDTIQVGYGAIPNAVVKALDQKKHLGVHTELLGDGLVELIKKGVVDNSQKSIHRGKTITSFSMGTRDTYDFIHDNPSIEFRKIDYTNNPLVIAQNKNMVAINSALQVDLTGQSTAESLGGKFYSGIGGQADFMRGAPLSQGGRTILALPSTAQNGEISRIVPQLSDGAGVTLHRADVQYVVTEYGIAYLQGKNIRERAMDLISIAHPKFRSGLIQQAKDLNLIYKDQMFIPGKRGEYPEHLESKRTTSTGLEILIRPVRISDETILKDFFYSLSDQSMYRRFISVRKDMPHERVQEFAVIDYTKEIILLAVVGDEEKETVVGMGEYKLQENMHMAEVAFVVRDEYQNKGIGTELLGYLAFLAKKQGLLGFTAEVLADNKPMLYLFEKMGFEMDKRRAYGVFELKMTFLGV
ncbi:MAG: GNAT family N-acetyltransferase [Candidatus Thermoplasmatota archaeon]|nr:GNAT family N-acetyltransferase [Candidatus Thermoplasmatota archaeon]